MMQYIIYISNSAILECLLNVISDNWYIYIQFGNNLIEHWVKIPVCQVFILVVNVEQLKCYYPCFTSIVLVTLLTPDI